MHTSQIEEESKESGESKNTDKKEKAEKKSKEELQAEREVYLTVGEDDADDEYSSVYSGISSFKWHPTENSMLLISEGDIYHQEICAQTKRQYPDSE